MRRTTLLSVLSIGALLTLGSPASAQQGWVRLGDFGHPVYMDTGAVVRRGPVAQVRLRVEGYDAAGYDRIETQEVNCRTHQSRVVRVVVRAVDARALGVPRPAPVDSVWRSYTPGSFGAELLGAVCATLGTPVGP